MTVKNLILAGDLKHFKSYLWSRMLSPKTYLTELKNSHYLLAVTRFYRPLILALSIVLAGKSSALADSITPNNDGTGTVVNSDGNTINIEGGSLSGDGKNLFHSFEQFGLSNEQIANFMSNPEIRNILGRINGGDASIINGLLQVTGGNSNLLLMNPAGIIFGENAQLNVPGDFTATTATGIGFDNNLWFNAVGENSYQSLVGTPNRFAFDNGNPAAVINNGELSLAEGKNLTLLGGNVINTGDITTPEGSVTLSAIPGSSSVRISQPGHLLSLDIEPPRDAEGNILPFTAKDLPTLLTSAGEVDTGLTPNDDGSITIDDASTSFVPEATLAIASGNINVSGIEGGQVNVTGNKVGVLSGNIDATGINAGGNVRVGGDFQGGGEIPNATHTIVDDNSTIAVDATDNGNGGQAIVWSDSLTRMTGGITARSGVNGGDGGLVEVSGKELLVFTGMVDAGSDLGQAGELLLDPQNIIVGNDNTALASLFSPTPEGEETGIAGFGIAVATVGEDLLVGSPANISGGQNNAGQAFLFDPNGNALQTYDNPNPVQGGFFGFSVAGVGNDQLLIGAPRNNVTAADGGVFTEAGQVFLFDKTNTQPLATYNNPNPGAAFISQGTFAGAVPLTDTNFGASLAVVDGDRFLIGAPGQTVTNADGTFPRAGQGFLIARDGSTLQTFNNPNPTAPGGDKGLGNAFGISVTTIDGNRGLIGATGNNNSAGQAFVYGLGDGALQATINNPQPNGERFGQSAATLNGDRIIIGAPRNSGGAGQAFVYNLANTDEPVITFNNPGSGGDFGDAIASAGENRVLLGARSNNGGAGQAYLFDTGNTDAPLSIFNNPNVAGGSFGTSVASLGGERVFIGASENTVGELTNSGEAFISLSASSTAENSAEFGDNIIGFNEQPGVTFTILPATITNITNTGTEVTLQASNDLSILNGQNIITDNPNADGGNITLQAGRNIEINSNITTDNGSLNIVANAPEDLGVVAGDRDPGVGEIAIADGVTLNTGTGNANLNVASGIGTRGNIDVGNITANNVNLTTGDGTVDVAGSINATGNVTVAGDEINFNGGAASVTGQTITLRGTASQSINVGNNQNTFALDLTSADITALTPTFTQITIGDVASTGTIRLFESVTTNGANPFQAAVNVPGGDTLIGPDIDTTWQITGSGNLNSIFVNGLTYGDIPNLEGGGANDTFIFNGGTQASVDGGAGNNTIEGNDNNNTYNITDLDTGNINEETAFADIQNFNAGDGNDTFSFIGDTPEITGNVDGGGGINTLDYDRYTGLQDDDFLFDPATGQATGINGTFTAIDDAVNIPNFIPPELENQVNSEVANIEEESTAREREQETPIPINNVTVGSDANSNNAIALLPILDSNFTKDYENYYDRVADGTDEARGNNVEVNLVEVQQNLKTIEESTGAKPALIYVAFFPTGVNALQGRNSNVLPQADDQLELITITEEGQPIRTQIKGITRADVDKVARRFSQSIFDQQPEQYYLPPAQQLYKWLIEPIKADLDSQEIDNLVFLMDSGLRTVPIAAMHDGEKYLVQEYSVGLMPSLSLTDTRYQNIADLGLLAMGSETFPADSALPPLPAVPVEVDIITQQLWSGGTAFTGENFTIDNLKSSQASNPFGILHLATHAEFIPGTPKNSFIQFGDRKLELDKVRELGLSNPQVELMVLSACKTAFGDPDAEFGFAGLAHQAGVKSALGSLWYVNDQGTLSIMSKFYQELKEAPIKAEALRRAQIAMIEESVRLEPGKLITETQTFNLPADIEVVDMTHPRYWSSFTIIGNPW